MPTTFIRLFQSPLFPEDEDKTRSALLLNVVLNTFLITLPAIIAGTLLGGNVPRSYTIIIILVFAWLTIFGTQRIMRSGRVSEAGMVTVITIFIATTLSVYNIGTIRAPATSFYLLTIVMSGLVIGRRTIIWMSALNIITIILFSLAEKNGFLPDPNLTLSITQAITFTVLVVVVGILLYLAVKSIDEALARARQELIERQRVEEKLRQSEETYRSLFENVQVGVALTSPTGKILKYNEAMLRQSGYSREDIENLESAADFYFDPNDRKRVYEILISQGYVKELPVQFKHKDDTPYDTLLWMTPTTINGEPYFQAVVQDITERKHAEEKLRASEERFRAMIENISEAIALIDGEGVVRYISPAGERMLGYPSAQRSGQSVFDNILTPWDVAGVQVIFRELKAEPQKAKSYVIQARHRDGSARWLETTAVNLLNLESVNAIVFNYRDITDRIRAEEEREKYVQELGRQKEELERFAYTISHDLRNPLVTIKGFLGALEQDLKNDRQDRVQSDFQRIAGAADKMHALLSELLELSRVGRIINPPENVDLHQLTQEALENLTARLSTTNVQVHVAADLPEVYVDRIRLREVLENLIDNAVKYMGNQTEPLIEIGSRDQGDEQVIFVKDNGIGVDSRFQTKIFGLFEKLNPASEGTGIGLALVKRIIETHGGKVWVESDGVGKGSTFCFTLPNGRENK
jgi:PAS domain S-box-containing protein